MQLREQLHIFLPFSIGMIKKIGQEYAKIGNRNHSFIADTHIEGTDSNARGVGIQYSKAKREDEGNRNQSAVNGQQFCADDT